MPRFGPKIFQYAEPALILYVFALSMHVQTLNQYVYYRISKEKGFPDNYTGHQTDCVKLNATLKELQKEVRNISLTVFHFQPAFTSFWLSRVQS